MKEGPLEQLSGIDDEDLPRMARVRRHRPSLEIEDLEGRITNELEQPNLWNKIDPGAEVAITVGSRGITNIVRITKSVVQYLGAIGARPFIFPAMGSHGGATALGQVEVLKKLGITEEEMDCPIRATMETLELGWSSSGIPVFVDRYAAEADGIFVINRIKPHTAFRGRIGSGLLKMMALGMGKGTGAQLAHRWAFGIGLDQELEVGKELYPLSFDREGNLTLLPH
ncbi:MAG: lactate racemase domain-containing protein [Candidatus Bipolaricaulia bacterium]